MKPPFFILLMLLIDAGIAFGQPVFNRVQPPAGKAFLHVTGMVQDPLGFMWLATRKGLFRYDGQTMISYKSDPLNRSSLATDVLECICTDREGNIWIGTTDHGLEKFTPATGVFRHYRHDPTQPASLANDFVATVFIDMEGTLWVGTGSSLDRYNAKTGAFIHYTHLADDTTSISSNVVRTIYQDREGTLWIGTGTVYGADGAKSNEGGLNRMDKKTGKFTRYMHQPGNPHSLINNKVRAIFEDSRGTFWIGTAGDGLHTMDRRNGTFQNYPYDPKHPEKLSRPPIHPVYAANDHITFITEDATGAIWIGTSESGINYYNPQTKRVTHYESQKEGDGAYTDRTAWWAVKSRDGILWISSLTGSLYRINPISLKVPFYPTADSSIIAFYEAPNDTLWLGSTQGSGLIITDGSGKVIKKLLHERTNKASLSNNYVNSMLKDRKGHLWVGTYGGLNLLDDQQQVVKHYQHDPQNQNTLGNDFVISLYEDHGANLWAGTVQGVNKLNTASGVIRRYSFSPSDTLPGSFFGANAISSICEDQQGQIWMSSGVQAGIYRLNKESGQFEVYLKGASLSSVLLDKQGIIWAGGADGLFQYRQAADTFYRFQDPVSRAEIDNIISMIEDDDGNLWARTANEIIKLNRQRNAITTFDKSFGVEANNIVFGSAYKGPSGKLYFGHPSGYYSFFPRELTKGLRSPEPLISAFYLSSQIQLPSEGGMLAVPIYRTKRIELAHNQNSFSFAFTAIDFTEPEANRLFYMLEKFDPDWNASLIGQRANYYNVPPGKYVFRVKAVNNSGLWSERKIEVWIMPPWWQRWWAYCLYAVLLSALIYSVHHYQRQRIIRQERERAKEKELAQAKEIEKAYAGLKATQQQLIQREKMASLGELTAGIAHEIQNPLNFVNNFSETNQELIEELQAEARNGNVQEVLAIAADLKANEEKVNHHGKRADSIVKAMLQHARASTDQKQPTSINQLADEYLRLSYQGMRAKDKSFEPMLQTSYDNTIGEVNVVPQDIGRVLLNLYNNAFYAVNVRKQQLGNAFEPKVSVTTKQEGSVVQIVVEDNGVGMSQKVSEKVFQPFFTTKPAGEGTGLGLSLSYDIVRAHGGELKLQSIEGKGSAFTVELPLNR